MCGISGFIQSNLNNQEKENILRKMLSSIAHRGPDDSGVFVDNWAAIGMQRLSIIDLNSGHQPIFSEDKRYSIVFNGEIYNYREIKYDLLQKGVHFQTETDTEVILQLYMLQGASCLKELNGMFAFAIYDSQKHELFLARDRFGIKPLYYSKTPQYFAFASELKALMQFPFIEKEIDTDALDYYLTMESVPAPLSIIKAVKKVMPGEYLLLSQDGFSKTKYYDLQFRPKDHETSLFEKKMTLDRLLENAVVSRMVADVPLGSFLSGGVDSSLVAYYLQKNSDTKINTFSIGFDEKSFDETAYAQKVAQHIGSNHHEARFTTKELLDVMPKISQKLDEPFADASLLPTFLLSQYTRSNVKVALSGDGADELFGGYPTYYARKMGEYFPPFTSKLIKPFVNLLPVSHKNMSFDFKAKKFVAGLEFEPDLRHIMWLGAFDFKEKEQLMQPEYLVKRKDNQFPLLEQHMRHCDTEDNWERSLYIDMRFYLQDNMLVKIDRASMYNSLEVRVPFLDHKVAEFAMHLPADLKYKGKESKFLLKHLAEMYLPADIVHRPKKGFGIPLSKWIREDLKELFEHYLSESRIKEQGIFNAAKIQEMLSDHITLKQDNRKQLYSLLVFQLWYDNFNKGLFD
jgi:asparagine synthase (glutamine-hydrolysing)